jgi:hypothetical protein
VSFANLMTVLLLCCGANGAIEQKDVLAIRQVFGILYVRLLKLSYIMIALLTQRLELV